MQISHRVKALKDSATLSLNAKATKLANEGTQVYNLTAGQLPFRPPSTLVDSLRSQTNLLGSFQYSPVPGFQELKDKFLDWTARSRNIELPEGFSCLISNGGKHSLSNLFSSVINPGDEVVLLAPYWLSYPQMIALSGGVVKPVNSNVYTSYVPSIEDVKNALTDKTKAIVITSPSNPTGVSYPKEWMQEFAKVIADYPDVWIFSDEIYFELSYYDPSPSYFYQQNPELLKRTVIFDGISKSLASTGLRMGYAIGPGGLIKSASKLQAHTASGANSLVQKAMLEYDFELKEEYLVPIRQHLRVNAEYLKTKLKENNLQSLWYQPTAAFYYLFDFSKTPMFDQFNEAVDNSEVICQKLLEQTSVCMVPSQDFGVPNAGRMSLCVAHDIFQVALDKLIDFCLQK